jgi:hypothetical protein
MTPVNGSTSANPEADRTASCPVIASATKRISPGETASTTARISRISSSSMCNRPAVSTSTVSRPVNFASRTPSLATATGSRAFSGEKTGMPT